MRFIKWTFQPVQARNAFFNLEKLGALVRSYEPNFYGTDYSTSADQSKNIGLDSDRLFAEWHLESKKVRRLAKNKMYIETGEVIKTIEIPSNWNALVESGAEKAVAEQTRIKRKFQAAFARKLICRKFERDGQRPKYLFYEDI